MKKKYLYLPGLTAMAVFVMAGGILAGSYMTTNQNDVGIEKITTKAIKVGLQQTAKEELKDAIDDSSNKIYPGEVQQLAYQVENNEKDAAYDIYVKVILDYGWSDDNLTNGGEDVYTKVFVENNGTSTYLPYITDYKQQKKIGKWIVAYADDEQAVLYYTEPLSKNEKSTNFMDGIKFDESMDNRFANADFNFDVKAYAVQANSAPEAIAAEWGVFPKFDKNGCITQVSESK